MGTTPLRWRAPIWIASLRAVWRRPPSDGGCRRLAGSSPPGMLMCHLVGTFASGWQDASEGSPRVKDDAPSSRTVASGCGLFPPARGGPDLSPSATFPYSSNIPSWIPRADPQPLGDDFDHPPRLSPVSPIAADAVHDGGWLVTYRPWSSRRSSAPHQSTSGSCRRVIWSVFQEAEEMRAISKLEFSGRVALRQDGAGPHRPGAAARGISRVPQSDSLLRISSRMLAGAARPVVRLRVSPLVHGEGRITAKTHPSSDTSIGRELPGWLDAVADAGPST